MSDKFISQILHGSIYLLLGQNYFYRKNPLIASVEEEYKIQPHFKSHDVFLELGGNINLQWITNRADFLLPPVHLEAISHIPWNGVLVTAVDGIARRFFSTPWREVQAYYDSKLKPPGSIADRERLIVSELFGEVGYFELSDYTFPTDKISFLKSRTNAITILSMYAIEFANPMTTLIIDGYDIDQDWLDTDILISVIPNIKGKVHAFGICSKSRNSSWKQYVDEGIIVEHEQTFAAYLAEKELQEELDIEEWSREYANSKLITIHGKAISIPKEVYNEASKDAIVLDDSIFFIENLPKQEEQDCFRRFLYQSGQRPVWEGYAWNFYFKRVAEEKLYNQIKRQLISNSIDNPPLILEGQAGCGKSVLLGKIAYRIKQEEEYPVLFIPQINSNIDGTKLLNFCNWLEEKSDVKRILILWDASVYNDDISRYVTLNDFLISKGKRILLVGSSLILSSRIKSNYHYKSFRLSVKLEDSEKESICEIFNLYSGRTITFNDFERLGLSNIFVACYRFLPPSRMNLRHGLVEEGKKNLHTLLDTVVLRDSFIENPFVNAFFEAGYYVKGDFLKESCDSENLKKIMEYICVPAQFNVNIPFTLLLRCFSSELSISIAEKIDEIDVFSFVETTEGDWIVGTRTSLEAELLLKSEISSMERQIKVIKHIVSCVRESIYFDTSHSEMNFLVEFLRAIGPNGRRREDYKEYFKDIADAIEKLRSTGITNSRIVLQEATLLREYAKEHNQDKIAILKRAQKLLEEEIDDILSDKRITSSQLGRLNCELASNLGAQIIEELINSNWLLIKELYRKQEKILRSTVDLGTESFHGLDICAWTAKGILSNKNAPRPFQQEIYKNFISLFEIALLSNPSLGDLADYHARLMEISEIYGDLLLTDEEFQILVEKGSCTGIYLRSRNYLKNVDFTRPLSVKNRKKCQSTINYLNKYKDMIWKDIHCLHLLFRIKWMLYTGEPILYREKTAIAIDKHGWQEIYNILETLLQLEPEKNNAVIKYIRAMALFHLKDRRWIDAFEEVSNISYPSHKRVIVNYLASDSQGKPIAYTGTIISGDGKKIRLRIEEIGRNVPYFNPNFARQYYVPGKTYGNVNLGFNFLGLQVVSLQGGR